MGEWTDRLWLKRRGMHCCWGVGYVSRRWEGGRVEVCVAEKKVYLD